MKTVIILGVMAAMVIVVCWWLDSLADEVVEHKRIYPTGRPYPNGNKWERGF
jgi:hypothetical protein